MGKRRHTVKEQAPKDKEQDWSKILVLIELAKLITWIVATAWGLPGAPS